MYLRRYLYNKIRYNHLYMSNMKKLTEGEEGEEGGEGGGGGGGGKTFSIVIQLSF